LAIHLAKALERRERRAQDARTSNPALPDERATKLGDERARASVPRWLARRYPRRGILSFIMRKDNS
jgi:hypothetical protein